MRRKRIQARQDPKLVEVCQLKNWAIMEDDWHLNGYYRLCSCSCPHYSSVGEVGIEISLDAET